MSKKFSPEKRPRVTIEDVAREAGVARGTVSRVLNGGYASQAARTKVEEAVKSTGYRTNIFARSLASGRTNVYAAVLTEPYGELFDDPTFGRMLQGISSELVGTEIALNLLFATNDEERARTSRLLEPGRVDGIIVLSPHIDDPLLEQISTSIPTVVCGPLEAQRHNTWTATVDDYAGGVLGGTHLLEQGCTRVAIIAGPAEAQGAHRRLKGQLSALGHAFMPGAMTHAPYSSAGGASAMRELLTHPTVMDGLLCGSDRQAIGALAVLAEAGLNVPEDVKVVGFDNHTIAATSFPSLTTIDQPIFEVGACASTLLHSAIRGEPTASLTLPTSLVVRNSTQPH